MKRLLTTTLFALGLGLVGYGSPKVDHPAESAPTPSFSSGDHVAVATFAGGCFWCMEPPFDKLPGVLSTTSGYTGGRVPNPSYEQVSEGTTGHVEAVEVRYDPAKISYQQLLEVFWHNVDPVSAGGQFCDRGPTYVSAIFYHNDEEQRLAEESKLEVQKRFSEPVVTTIRPAGPFYPAETYHQDFYEKNPVRYKYYRWRCGRDARLTELWGTAAH